MRPINDKLSVAAALALATAVISGVSTFINKIAVTGVKEPIAFSGVKNAVVAIGLIAAIVLLGKTREIVSLERRDKLRLLAVGLIGGSVPFALFFTGLSMTSAVNAGLIHKTMFVWVLLLAIPFLKERMSPLQWLGAAMLFGANLFVGGFKGFEFNRGELMIAATTLLWAVESIVAKKALANVPTLTVAAARLGIGALVLLPIAWWKGGLGAITGMTAANWGWTLLTAVFLAGYVLTWYAALKRAPAGFVACLLVPATLITNVLSAVFVTHAWSGQQAIAALLFAAGAALIVIFARQRSAKTLAAAA